MTGSAISATLVLVAIAALAGASPGRPACPGHHQRSSLDTAYGLAAVARRAGRAQIAMRHLPDVFVITPSGSLLAPAVVELQLNR
jgi:hypothetical protein